MVPLEMRQETLTHGHQGIQQCKLRIAYSVWWPGVSTAIEHFVQSCSTYQKLTALPTREPLITTTLPNYPWERIATDLFEQKGCHYLVAADYFSRFIEVQKLKTMTSSNIVTQLKTIFARFGISATMVTDNGPQFDSHEVKEFAQAYEFQHTTTSPYFPGFIERMLKTVKKLLEHSVNPFKSILSYRTRPSS